MSVRRDSLPQVKALRAEAPASLNRPDHVPIPVDEAHEFFQVPLLASDPVVALWERHFRSTRTAYRLKGLGRHKVMIYTHRFSSRAGAYAPKTPRWCCSEEKGQ